jgi:hypothetical protein
VVVPLSRRCTTVTAPNAMSQGLLMAVMHVTVAAGVDTDDQSDNT